MKNQKAYEEGRRMVSIRLGSMRRTVTAFAEGDVIGDNCLTGSDILSIDHKHYVDIQLSWGGPADWIRVYLNESDITDVEYHYADWSVHEQIDLWNEEKEVIIRWIEEYLSVNTLIERGS